MKVNNKYKTFKTPETVEWVQLIELVLLWEEAIALKSAL